MGSLGWCERVGKRATPDEGLIVRVVVGGVRTRNRTGASVVYYERVPLLLVIQAQQ